MASPEDSPASGSQASRLSVGRVLSVGDDFVIFNPLGSRYELWKLESGPVALGTMVNIVVAPGISFEAMSQPAAA